MISVYQEINGMLKHGLELLNFIVYIQNFSTNLGIGTKILILLDDNESFLELILGYHKNMVCILGL